MWVPRRASSGSATAREFELFCAEELKRGGWRVTLTGASRDQGADMVAERAQERLIVQCKLLGRPVGNYAVQEVVAARSHHQGNRALVAVEPALHDQLRRARRQQWRRAVPLERAGAALGDGRRGAARRAGRIARCPAPPRAASPRSRRSPAAGRGSRPRRAQARAQHLAPLAEGRLRDLRQRRAQLGRRLIGPRGQADHAGAHLGRRRERRGRQVEQALDPAQPLRHHREPAIVAACRARQRAGAPPPSGTSAPCARCSPAARTSERPGRWRHCRAGWRRCGSARRRASAQGSTSSASASTSVRRPPARGSSSRSRATKRGIALDGDDARAARIEQGARQPAGSGADLEHRGLCQLAGGRSDPAQDRRVEQEVLAQPLVGRQSETAQLGAQLGPGLPLVGGRRGRPVRAGRRQRRHGAGRAGSGWPAVRTAPARCVWRTCSRIEGYRRAARLAGRAAGRCARPPG